MIVLDTHTLVWWVNSPEKLTRKARKLIEKEKKSGVIFISSISIWEICLLVKYERLALTMDITSWLAAIEKISYVQFIPVDNTIASRSVMLPGEFHKDPADRIIVATAREHGATLITIDEKIRKYPHVQTLW